MPAEWEKHQSLWLAWPHDEITFPNRVLKVQAAYIDIIKALHQTEVVNLLVLEGGMQDTVTTFLAQEGIDLDRIVFHTADYADAWIRDYGPMFVHNADNGQKAWIKWQYNAYSNKFPDLLKDTKVFYSLKNTVESPMIDIPMVLEGGSIEVNGRGTLITTEQCLLNSNRNPKLSKAEIENHLMTYVGASNIIWLKEGIVNDHTDGHIDDFVKFVNTTTIMCAYEDNPSDPNFLILDAAYKTLVDAVDQNGNQFTVVKLPMPHFNYDDGSKAPASYANFYIGNGVVLVPTYKDANDALALKIISDFFPERKVIGIDSTDLIYGGGSIHCITQQEPA